MIRLVIEVGLETVPHSGYDSLCPALAGASWPCARVDEGNGLQIR